MSHQPFADIQSDEENDDLKKGKEKLKSHMKFQYARNQTLFTYERHKACEIKREMEGRSI